MTNSSAPAKRWTPRRMSLLLVVAGLLFGSTACTRIATCSPVPESLTRVAPPDRQILVEPTIEEQEAELNKIENDRRKVRRYLAIIDAQQQACRE